MFGGNYFLNPGSEFKKFNVLKKSEIVDQNGDITNQYKVVGNITAALASAKPEERERWHQTGHLISHKIIGQFNNLDITVNNILEYNQRIFSIHGVDNIGELGHWAIYYCEERGDKNG